MLLQLRRFWLLIRHFATVLAASALALGALAAAPASAAVAGPTAAPAGLATGARGPLDASAASAQARKTGKPVVVSALTTPTSLTTARPDGEFTVRESLLPVRAWRNGAWRKLDPALHRDRNGTVRPAVTTSPLALSGGGSVPLAVMNAFGRTLALSWPGRLPRPHLSGATATYPDVLPGVDLVVTANAQGGFSDVLVVTSAAAAASPALTSVKLAVSAPGLRIAASAGGGLRVATSPKAAPLFTAPAPFMWDSSPLPAGTATAAGPGGSTVAARSGLPARSTPTAPGAGAHLSRVPVIASGSTVTLRPPARALAGRGVVYPVYIDPTWWPTSSSTTAWTQIDSGYPTTSYWKESSDLQMGLCDFTGCNNVKVARSFAQLPIPSHLTAASVVNAAYLYMTDVWSADGCTATAAQLWETGGIGSSTTWNTQPSWTKELEQKSFAFGSSDCGYYKNDVTWSSSALTSLIQSDAGHASSQTFGIRAASETNDLEWKQFLSGSTSSNITLSVTYNDPPNQPSSLSTNPGGACSTSASSQPAIGDDDVTFSAHASDNDGDNSLVTRFVIVNSNGSTAYDSSAAGTSVTTGDNTTASLTLTRSVMQGLNTGGSTTTYDYHWYAMTTDGNNLTSATSSSCYFSYDPLGPAAPTVTLASGSASIGQSLSATFTAPAGCGQPGANTCPASYSYQLGATAPVTVTADSSNDWSGTIPVQRLGPMLLKVYATDSSGNVSADADVSVTGNAPATAYADGDLNGDGQPDLLVGGTGANPGLWMLPGIGAGTVGRATNVGGAGTAVNTAGSPADWSGAQVLHGDFTGHGVQDVMAYYPSGTHAGTGEIIGGTGDGGTLQPYSGNNWSISSLSWSNPFYANYNDVPSQLVAAGDASETNTSGLADVIGIYGDATSASNGSPYELDLYSVQGMSGSNTIGGYGYDMTLSTASPDGSSDWQDYTLATAQPGGSTADTVLFALDTQTGGLYESVNPGCGTTSGCSQTTLIGMSGTWQQVTTPWGSAPPALLQGDVNASGQTELWTATGGAITSYAVTGSPPALTQETSGTLFTPAHQWPINEGSGTTAHDTTGSLPATLAGTPTWTAGSGEAFAPSLILDGTSNALATSQAALDPAGSFSVSAWVNPAAAGGVAVSQDMTQTSSFKIYPAAANGNWEFCMATSDTATASYTCASGGTVRLGMWTHLTASYQASTGIMKLYDNGTDVSYIHHTALTGTTNGGFQIGDAQASGSHTSYFKGQIADVQAWSQALGPAANSAPGYYQAMTPTRLLDTRYGTGGTTGPVSGNGTVTLQVTGTAGIPSDNVSAVVLSTAVLGETSSGYIIVYPGNTPRPRTSNLNYVAGTSIANLVTVPVGPDGQIKLFNASGGTVQLVVDAFGYFTTDATKAGDSTYTPMPATTRILDTRFGTGAPKAKLTGGSTLRLQIGGANGIPSSVSAVAINLAAMNETGTGYLVTYADGTSKPGVSNLQYGTNPIAGMAIVPVGSDGKIAIYVSSNSIDLVGDVSGYFTPGTSGDKYHTLGATRIVDTRLSGQTVASDGVLTVSDDSITAPDAVINMNLTALRLSGDGYFNPYPAGATEPHTANVTFVPGQTIPDVALPPVGTNGGVDIPNHSSGNADMIVDTMGYFSPS